MLQSHQHWCSVSGCRPVAVSKTQPSANAALVDSPDTLKRCRCDGRPLPQTLRPRMQHLATLLPISLPAHCRSAGSTCDNMACAVLQMLSQPSGIRFFPLLTCCTHLVRAPVIDMVLGATTDPAITCHTHRHDFDAGRNSKQPRCGFSTRPLLQVTPSTALLAAPCSELPTPPCSTRGATCNLEVAFALQQQVSQIPGSSTCHLPSLLQRRLVTF